jgi:hypothetical protein
LDVLYATSKFLPTSFFMYILSKRKINASKYNTKYFLKKVDYEIIFKIKNCLHLENLAFLVWAGPVVDLLDVSLPVVVSGKRFSAMLTAKRFHAYQAPSLSHRTFLL